MRSAGKTSRWTLHRSTALILKAAWVLGAFQPLCAMAQQPSTWQAPAMGAHRADSWEFSLGGGVLWLDPSLRDFLESGPSESRFTNVADAGRRVSTAVVRVGYNFTPYLGFSLGMGDAVGSGVRYLNPFGSVTYTVNLNARTSPFLLVGSELTRIEGDNDRVTHTVWGAHAGVGVRQMLSNNLALRLESRVRFQHYHEVPMRNPTTYSPLVTLGLSYFVGRRMPRAETAPQWATRVDTVRVVRVDTVLVTRVDTVRMAGLAQPVRGCETGIAPPGIPVDEYGCVAFPDTLLLESVHFAFDESGLSATARGILDRVAESMLAHPELFFEIAGHADSVGTLGYNELLSTRRAVAVRDYLMTCGVPSSHMTAVGYGETFPIAPNATAEGRALNRRGVELRIRRR